MDTEITLYKQQLAANPRFLNQQDYGWLMSGNGWFKSTTNNTLFHSATGGPDYISQNNILEIGKEYIFQFTISDYTSGNLTFRNCDTCTTFITASANGIFTNTFKSLTQDIMLLCSNDFEGVISSFSISEYPYTIDLDVTNDVSIPLNFNIDTIFDLSQRKATYSKSIILPGTDNNNKAFGNSYVINNESGFKPIFKSRVLIKNSGIILFDGILSLDNITEIIKNNNTEINYNVSVYGEIVDAFSYLDKYYISDLDFSEYYHPFDIDNIIYSFTEGVYKYGATTPNQQVTYTSPDAISVSIVSIGGINRVKIVFLSDHTFIKGEDVFVAIGNDLCQGNQTIYDIPSSDSIILEITELKTTGGQGTPNGRVYRKEYLGFGYAYPMCDYGSYQKTMTSGVFDIGTNYFIQEYVFPDDFTNIGASTNATGISFIATGNSPFDWTGKSIISTLMPVSSGLQTTKESNQIDWVATDFIPHIYVNEIYVKMKNKLNIEINCPNFETDIFKRFIIPCDQKAFNLDEGRRGGPRQTLKIGVYYYIKQYSIFDDFTNVGGVNSGNTFFMATGSTPSAWGVSLLLDVVNLNQYLPKMKLSDFFKSLLNIYNLAIINNPENSKSNNLLNRGDFYSNDIINWSDKYSSNDVMELKLSNSLLPQYYSLKYKKTTDFFNKDYDTDFGINNRTYGDKFIDTNNQFSNKPNETEITFSPTILAGPISGHNAIYNRFSQTFSVCYSMDSENGNSITRESINRILILGIQGSRFGHGFRSTVDDTENTYPFPIYMPGYSSALGGFIINYAGHIDNVWNPYPIHDLNFGSPEALYMNYGGTGPGTVSLLFNDKQNFERNNIYTKYWKRYINQFNSPFSKIITCTLKLSSSDIYLLDFSKLYNINGYIMKLNKIIDWDIINKGICKVEFLLKNT